MFQNGAILQLCSAGLLLLGGTERRAALELGLGRRVSIVTIRNTIVTCTFSVLLF
jgi:hypothetical protein